MISENHEKNFFGAWAFSEGKEKLPGKLMLGHVCDHCIMKRLHKGGFHVPF